MDARRTFVVLIALTLLATPSTAVANSITPVLTTIVITPDNVSLNVGESQQFSATGYDQYGNKMPIAPVWTASGGIVDASGLYTAPGAPGNFSVTATDTGIDGTIHVPVYDPAQSIIVDNRDRNTRSYGQWQVSSAKNPWGRNSLYSTRSRAWFRWYPALPAGGHYEVAAWWTQTSGRSKRVPYRVHFDGGVAEIIVNQRENGGQWISLGTYPFTAGSSAFVSVSGENGPVCADAIRLRPTGAVPPTLSVPEVLTARVGKPFTQVIQTTGTPPIAVNVTGLPGWLAFDGVDTLSGTSPAQGSWPIQVTATNAGGIASQDVRVDSRNPCIIVDNRDPNTRRQATWERSRAQNPWGRDSFYSLVRRARFWWDPVLPEDGFYEVSAWWTRTDGRSRRVPYRVHHADGIAERIVNQRENGGQWNSLGTYRFAAGSPAFVVVSGENGPVCADAVRFCPVAPDPPTIIMPILLVTQVGKPFTQVIRTTGTPNITVAVNNLPAWLSFDGVDTLTGTSPGPGSWAIQVVAQNPGGADVRNVEVQARNPGVIVDNRDPNTARRATWLRSDGRNPWERDSRYATSRWAWFRWYPALPADGDYEVFAWWTSKSGRSKRVPYRVHHAGGVAEVVVNQRENGGKWMSLGTYPFTTGGPAFVVVSGENGPVCADAVKFEQIPPVITTLVVLGVSATSDDLTILVVPKQGPAPLAVEGFVLDLPAGETAEWDFGDGTTATGENVAHTFESPGTYTVKVRAGTATGEETVVVTGEE